MSSARHFTGTTSAAASAMCWIVSTARWRDGELSGRKLYFVFQGAAPEQWMLEAGEYTMKRFAGLYGMTLRRHGDQ